MATKEEKDRAKKIAEAIKITFDSLDSHLEYVYDPDEAGSAFHKKCVQEYATIIKILSELY